MKNRWVYIPVVLSFILLVAHFSRNHQNIFMLLSVALPFGLLIKKNWSKILIQVSLVMGVVSWVLSTLKYIEIRKTIGEDYQRLAIILFSVAAFTLISALLLFLVKPKTRKKTQV